MASVIIGIGETASFDVTYQPTKTLRSKGIVRLAVVDNQYEDSIVQLVGESYEDEICLDNVHSLISIDQELQEGNMADDNVTGILTGRYQV